MIWECTQQSWTMGIGDPGIMGWVIVGLYVASGCLSLIVAIAAPLPESSAMRERIFWICLGFILLVLAVNKQLDLQSLMTAFARCMAQIQGWYDNRRIAQVGFIVILLVAMILGTLFMWRILDGTMRRTWLALLGLAIVLTFVAIRAVGFHHMDRLINFEINDVRMNWLLEMTGPLMVLCAGGLNLRRVR